MKWGKKSVIPITSPTHYVTGIHALNLQAPEGTSGDWHFSSVFYVDSDQEPIPLELAGEGERINTNPIYGTWNL